MNVITRGIKNAFRNVIRTVSLVVILGISVGLALAMLGPGVSSLDALLFGRKRIDISPH